uniref:Odorant receptor n=1 Tax=Dendrolimus punctatus TaxID=238572 RepID=A0A2K8GKW3_9NEOP|nr:Odorant Receptor 49 [Dendrolimus punctatus]
MSEKTYNNLKGAFLYQMDFISDIGTKCFVCPFIGKTKMTICCYYVTQILVLFTSVQLLLTLFLSDFRNWFAIVYVAPNLGACLMITIKYAKLHMHRDLYSKVLQHFRIDLWDVITDSFEHRIILYGYTKTNMRITKHIYYYTIGLSIVVTISPRLIMYIETNVLGNELRYLYPFDGWYPFDKVQWYYVTYVWESFMTTLVVFIYAFANMIHISLTRYVCMELKILCNVIEGLISSEDVIQLLHGRNLKAIHKSIKKKLKTVIKRHQFLAQVTLELDTVFGDATLLTYVFGSIFVCLTIFTATVVDNFYMSLRYFSFFCSLLVEVFFPCIMGQLLIDHSKKLENAIYFTDWTYADIDTKRMLLIFLIRSQKPFRFSAKGYLTMNLCTFSNICSFSYQLFNLLQRTYH